MPAACSLSGRDRKSTRLNSSHDQISYAVFCLKKKKEGSRAAGPRILYTRGYERAGDAFVSRLVARFFVRACLPRAARAVVTGCFFFFNDTATTEIYTLSLHDALPI